MPERQPVAADLSQRPAPEWRNGDRGDGCENEWGLEQRVAHATDVPRFGPDYAYSTVPRRTIVAPSATATS
jgi:hypothetical protein